MKRTPLLYDEMLALTPKRTGRVWPQVSFMQQRLRAAKVFRLDHAAAAYAASMIVAHPEAIARDVEFAIPPFERMYVELPYPEFFKILSAAAPEEYRSSYIAPPEEEDQDIGYLFDGPLVYVMSRAMKSAKNPFPMVLPIRYRLNRTFSFEEEQVMTNLLDTSRLGIDALFWGSCFNVLHPATMRALRTHHSCEFWYGNEHPDFAHVVARAVLKPSAGDLRNIVALPLFLNRTREVQLLDTVPPAPGFVHAKPRTLVRHNVVRLRLDPGPLLKRVFTSRASGGWRREHDVRGHWCGDRTYHANTHDHDLREIAVNRWKCLRCGGQRWWRKAHKRGRKDQGQVITTYEVMP